MIGKFVLKGLALISALWLTSGGIANAHEMRIVNIRVGQGDATLVQGPLISGKRVNVLIDAGNIGKFDGGKILRRVLQRYGVEKKLDYMVISHDDQDHLGGLVSGRSKGSSGRPNHGDSFLLGFNNVPGCLGDDDGDGSEDWLPGEVNYKPDPDEIGTCDDMKVVNWVDYGEANIRDVSHGEKYNGMANSMGNRIALDSQQAVDNFEIDLGEGAVIRSYASHGFVRGKSDGPVADVTSPNEKSIALLVSYRQFDYLISGDLIGKGSRDSIDAKMEQAVGKAIKDENIMVDVLHVNHHGADNGSAAEFLADIKPNIAVISAGNDNRFSHPRNSVLKRLRDADVYRTVLTSFGTSAERLQNDVRDRVAVFQNDVVITSDGYSYYLSTSRGFHSDSNCMDEPNRCSRGL